MESVGACTSSKMKCVVFPSGNLPWVDTFHSGGRLDEGLNTVESGNGPFSSGSPPSFSEVSVGFQHLDSQGILERV